MRKAEPGVLGIFARLEPLLEACKRLRREGVQKFQVITPIPVEEVQEILEKPRSSVRLFALIGGMLGMASGFALTIWTSLDIGLISGGKPIISLPAYVVIAFEMTILFGALGTVLGLFWNIRLPRFTLDPFYDPKFSEDHFGLWIPCGALDAPRVEASLRSLGAEEVRFEKG